MDCIHSAIVIWVRAYVIFGYFGVKIHTWFSIAGRINGIVDQFFWWQQEIKLKLNHRN